MSSNRFDVIVVGAGAAGLMCAIEAGKRGRRVVVLEKGARIGRKILISGGGRCNFTNFTVTPKNFISQNEHFCTSALARFTPTDFIALIKKHGIAYHEKKLGQLFCDDSAKSIVAMLETECAAADVVIRISCGVSDIVKEGDSFYVKTEQGDLNATSVVIACGGLTVPKISTDFGYKVARKFGLAVTEVAPALVALDLKAADQKKLCELSGISLDAEVSFEGVRFRENILVTHRGLSGPAILQISSYWKPGEAIHIDLLPEKNILNELKQAKASADKTELKNFLAAYFPKRFAAALCDLVFPSKPLNQCTDAELHKISDVLHDWQVCPIKTQDYDKAEVTLGGVSTDELSSKTMAAKKVPGMFFVGEVVDVTGWLGGYNFQWAWASGYAAGQFT